MDLLTEYNKELGITSRPTRRTTNTSKVTTGMELTIGGKPVGSIQSFQASWTVEPFHGTRKQDSDWAISITYHE